MIAGRCRHMPQFPYRPLTSNHHHQSPPRPDSMNRSPIITPPIASRTSSVNGDVPLVQSLSASSVQSLAEIFVGSSTSSVSPIQLDTGNVEAVTEDGLRHSTILLEAR